LRELYSRLEFKTWLAEVLGQSADTPATAQSPAAKPAATPDAVSAVNYQLITTSAQLEHWLQRLEQAELFAFDTETTSLDYMQAELVGLSFAITAGEAAYVPLAHIAEGTPPQLDREQTLARMKALLENPQQRKVGQNLKYDKNVLANHGIDLQGIVHDTMLESYVLDSTASRHDMDSLALKYLSYKTVTFEDIAGKGKDQLRFDQIALEPAAHYAAEDADITLRLHQTLWPKLGEQPALRQLYESIEIPLVPVLARMEYLGVLIDADKLRAQSGELVARIAEIEQEAYTLAGAVFNLGSPKQIQDVLFEQQGLPVLQKTPTGQPSTAEAVLQELALDYPLPKLILEHRSLSKLKSTYTDKLPEQINPRTGRVHTCYQQAVASTGRLSSTDPNLQNIPIRSLEGRRIRQAFIAPAGYKIVAADYSQIELRIMAHLSGDAGLLRAFADEADIHRATAAEVFGLDPEQVSSEQRRSAKAINFGLIYGMSAFGLAKQLGIDRGAAQEYVERYFARYPGVKAFMDSTRALAHERGYVETVFGRRLYLPEINHRNAQRRQYAERTAINAPMQGTAADIIKRAMIAVDGWIQEQEDRVRLIMQVHDELVFEVADPAVDQARAHITDLMCQVAELSVPLRVETGVGLNWDEAH
jgi:DNA polymerase-1